MAENKVVNKAENNSGNKAKGFLKSISSVAGNVGSTAKKFGSAVDDIGTTAAKIGITVENVGNAAKKVTDTASMIGESASNVGNMAVGVVKSMATPENVSAIVKVVSETAINAGTAVLSSGGTAVELIKNVDLSNYQFTTEDILRQAMKVPLVKISREQFLRKELIKYYPDEVIDKAIMKNPAYAGIGREKIGEIASQVINYETNKVSAISFAAGIPGGIAMAATIPADITQFFGFIIRVMQKLAYLYGFPEFEFSEAEVSDDTMNEALVFLGVMFGVQGANAGVKTIAESATKMVSKSLAQKALTKGTVYPIVKKVAQSVGIKMTKQVFANGVAKVVPVVGGVVSGGLTYVTFKPCSIRLQNSFKDLKLSDPEFYQNNSALTDIEHDFS